MTETKCERQAEKLGFIAENASSLIELAEQDREALKDKAIFGEPDDSKDLAKVFMGVETAIAVLKSCLAIINSGQLCSRHWAKQNELEAKLFLEMKYGEVDA